MAMRYSNGVVVQLEMKPLRFTELEYYTREPVPVTMKVDFESLLRVVQDVLKHSTSLAHQSLLGKVYVLDDGMRAPPSINCSLDLLKRIHCKVACGADTCDDAKVADAIVNNIVPNYSSFQKALLTLAALALSYGELMFFAVKGKVTPFASLITSLRCVDGIHRVTLEEQFRKAIFELNEHIKLALQLIQIILELDNLSKIQYINVTGIIADDVDRFSLFAIRFIVRCMTLVNLLTCERIKTGEDLTSTAGCVINVIQHIKDIIVLYKSQMEWEAYSKLHTSICGGFGIVEVMTRIMYPGQAFLELMNHQTPVSVDELKGKNVLLFISRVDNICDYDFRIMKEIHKMVEEKYQDYKIVWIPFLEDSICEDEREKKEGDDLMAASCWPMVLMQQFEAWKMKMPWYIVNYERSKQIVGIKYIKERWNFNCNPIAVHLNSKGQIECIDSPDVMPMIRAWQTWAFPFNGTVLDHGIRPIISSITNGELIDKEDYIFLYGGTEKEWIKQFGKNVMKLESEIKKKKVSLTSLAVTGEINSSLSIEQFWSCIESLLCVKMQFSLCDDDMTKHIQKLLSFKDKKGWAMLCKGPKVLACSYESIIMETVIEWNAWTKLIEGTNNFEICLRNYLQNKQNITVGPKPLCCHMPFRSLSGWIPLHVQCPYCNARMERVITYECCHKTLDMKK